MNDKLKHLIGGVILGSATYFSNHWLIGLGISSGLFVGNEISDMYNINTIIYKHKATGFDKLDLFADYLGFAIGFTISVLGHGIFYFSKYEIR